MAAVPNALSLARLALAVAFPFLAPAWRLPVVLIGGFTDWLDGFVARRYHAQSAVGSLLDGVADKAFVLAVLVPLALEGTIAWWQVAWILLRDMVVAVVALYLALRGEWRMFTQIPARMPGKVTTALLFLWIVAVLVPLPASVTTPLFVLLAASSLTAAVDYGVQFGRALRADGT